MSSTKRGKRGDKGKPRWTAYLLWSTRKRRDVVVDHPDWTFAQIAKWISDEWKKIESDEKDELQKEAEEMNELGIRKLPRDDDGPDPDKDTTDEDSDFEEGYRKKSKPIMLKIKKEKKRDRAEGVELESDESDWEPEAEVMPPEREQTRSGRQRKRPSFFQEFESQENNLDSILAEFEQTQAKEFGKPREPKPPPKPPGERRPRKRKAVSTLVEKEEPPMEVETLRSGRKRKVRRVLNAFMDEDDEDYKLRRGASSDDDDFEPPPEEEVEKIEENDDLIEEDEELDEDLEDEEDDDDEDNPRPRKRRDMALPPKKRGRPKKILTDAEIEEATRAAMGAKPVIEITRVPRAGDGLAGDGPIATGATSVIMGPVAGTLGSLDTTAGEGDCGPVTNLEGVTTTDIVSGHMVESVGDQVQVDALGQLAAVVTEQDMMIPIVTAKKSAPALVSEEATEAAKPTWVNETLASDDETSEQDKTGQASTDSPANGAFNPLAESGEENPLGEDTAVNNPLGVECGASQIEGEAVSAEDVQVEQQEQQPMNEEDALLATATEQPPFVNECQEEEVEAVIEGGNMLEEESDNPLAGIDGQSNEQAEVPANESDPFCGEQQQENESDPFTGEQHQVEKQPIEQAAMSEEDLLTGPAHNLDDSQYKADYVDPNLDDIFK